VQSRFTTSQRNYLLGVFNGFLYTAGEIFFDPTLVVVVFLSYLTDSPFLLGLIVPIRDAAWALPQLWVSGILQSYPKKVKLYRQASIARIISWILMIACIYFVREKNLLIILFFIVYTLASLMNGLGGLPFMEIVGKTIEPRSRGEYFAWRYGLGGLGGVLASFGVKKILDESSNIQFPDNFGLLAVLFAIFASLGLIAFSMIREEEVSHTLPKEPLKVQLRKASLLIKKDSNFSKFLFIRAVQILGGSAIPFYAIYVQKVFGASTAFVGYYLAFYTISNLLANFIFGRMTRRFGNKRVMNIATTAGLLMSAVVLSLMIAGSILHISPIAGAVLLIPAFILNGFRATGLSVSSNALMLDLSPTLNRSLYIGFANTLLGLVILMTGVSGVLLKLLGLNGLLIVTIFLHIAALLYIPKLRAENVE